MLLTQFCDDPQSTMVVAWEKRYSTVIRGLTYRLVVPFNNETDLRNWELMMDQIANYYQDVHYAIHVNASQRLIDSAVYNFLGLAEHFRDYFGNERVPQDVRLNVQEIERVIHFDNTDFGIDAGVFYIPE